MPPSTKSSPWLWALNQQCSLVWKQADFSWLFTANLWKASTDSPTASSTPSHYPYASDSDSDCSQELYNSETDSTPSSPGTEYSDHCFDDPATLGMEPDQLSSPLDIRDCSETCSENKEMAVSFQNDEIPFILSTLAFADTVEGTASNLGPDDAQTNVDSAAASVESIAVTDNQVLPVGRDSQTTTEEVDVSSGPSDSESAEAIDEPSDNVGDESTLPVDPGDVDTYNWALAVFQLCSDHFSDAESTIVSESQPWIGLGGERFRIRRVLALHIPEDGLRAKFMLNIKRINNKLSKYDGYLDNDFPLQNFTFQEYEDYHCKQLNDCLERCKEVAEALEEMWDFLQSRKGLESLRKDLSIPLERAWLKMLHHASAVHRLKSTIEEVYFDNLAQKEQIIADWILETMGGKDNGYDSDKITDHILEEHGLDKGSFLRIIDTVRWELTGRLLPREREFTRQWVWRRCRDRTESMPRPSEVYAFRDWVQNAGGQRIVF